MDANTWTITWRGDQTKTGKRTGVPHVLPLIGRSREIVQAGRIAGPTAAISSKPLG